MNRADEKWVELVRQQKYRGVPLHLRETTNRVALAQTDALMPKATAEKFGFSQVPQRPGPNQCQHCGQELLTDQSRRRLVRKVYLAKGKSQSYYIGDCCLAE